MDDRAFHDDAPDTLDSQHGGVGEAEIAIGSDERRMHVRAYNHWVSLLKGRACPAIGDLDPESIADFGAHSVLIDFSGGLDDPTIQFLGRALREECGVDQSITRIAEVPARSLLSRLTDHYLQIIANRAPIGFEAEFVGTRGNTMFHRGILMPFSSDGGDTIDFIYGVINWKEMVTATLQADLERELAAAPSPAPAIGTAAAPVWADGPGASGRIAGVASGALADRLALARESAAAARAADTRTRAALYRALGRAHDFAIAAAGDADRYAALLADAGIKAQPRAPMTAIAKLVFGAHHDKTRLTEIATVLAHASREGVAEGGLADFLDSHPGGIKAVVAAERAARRPALEPAHDAGTQVARRVAMGALALETGGAIGDVVVLVGRISDSGMVEVVGAVANDDALVNRAVRALR